MTARSWTSEGACACCGSVPTVSCGGVCPTVAQYWCCTISGVTGTLGDSCEETAYNGRPGGDECTCASFNGTVLFTNTPVSSEFADKFCVFVGEAPCVCGHGEDSAAWGFIFNNPANTTPYSNVSSLYLLEAQLTYTLDGEINCLGCNTFTLTAGPDNFTCTGWPTSITICPCAGP